MTIRWLIILLTLLIVAAMPGCSTPNINSEDKEEFKSDAKSAWNAVSFAMNIANPLYYAEKGAEYGYHAIKDDDN